MTRDERQKICVKNWLKNNGTGVIVAPTGLGKTRIGILCVKAVITKYPNLSVLVVVPTTNLKDQWENVIASFDLTDHCTVCVINTVITQEWNVDMMIVDEIHTSASKSFIKIYECVHYKLLLGLTATFKRLDDRHKLLEKICPIVDEVTLAETIINHWISDYTEYEVLIDVDNIDEYKSLERQNTAHFEFFNFDFKLVMAMTGPKGFETRKAYSLLLCKNDPKKFNSIMKEVTYHSMQFMKTMQQKKLFINNHSKKIELARKIISMRPDSKIITFSSNIKMAEAIGGPVYTGKDTKKRSTKVLDDFVKSDKGVINSVAKLIAGFDAPGIDCEIVLGHNSSSLRAIQTRGRGVRKEGDKHTEIFNLVINDTKDVTWFENSHQDNNIIKIDEENLMKVLAGEPFDTYHKPLSRFSYRF